MVDWKKLFEAKLIYRERILASHFTNCEVYFINCKINLSDFLNLTKQTFLIFDLIYFTDRQDYPFL